MAAAATAVAASVSAWMPGEFSDSTAISSPASSMAASRSPVRSSSRRDASRHTPGCAMEAVPLPYPASSGVTKCSSSAIVRILTPFLPHRAWHWATGPAAPAERTVR